MDSSEDQAITRINNRLRAINEQLSILNDEKISLLDQLEDAKQKKQLNQSMHLANQDWERENFKWSHDVQKLLKNTFRLSTFRPKQLSIINATLSQHNVLYLAPTGGGKSLTFQLPAMITNGFTLVVSPLISLMEDQLWALRKLGIEAKMLNSNIGRQEINEIISIISTNKFKCPIKLLYVTPERIATNSKRFMAALQKAYNNKILDRIAIDEVHCCSQWGHDFRPDYKALGGLKILFPDVPIIGVTATATTKVILDVQKMLNIQGCLLIKSDFNRPNLYYHILDKPSDKQSVVSMIGDLLTQRYKGQSGIIYTFSVNDAQELAKELKKWKLKVQPYHASLTPQDRTRIHNDWIQNKLQAVVATVAFGMGIDKPDVRFVIHHTMSKSMENFYQESGRAGRDGLRAECLLCYKFEDMQRITSTVFSEHTGLRNIYAIIKYCIDKNRCRRQLISKHFSDVWEDNNCNKMCDHCMVSESSNSGSFINLREVHTDLSKIIDRAEQMNSQLTALKLLGAWLHSGSSEFRLPGAKKPKCNKIQAAQILAYLITRSYLKEHFHITEYKAISYIHLGTKSPDETDVFYFSNSVPLPLTERNLNSESNGSLSSTNSNKVKRKKYSYIDPPTDSSSSDDLEDDSNLSDRKVPIRNITSPQRTIEIIDSDLEIEEVKQEVIHIT